MGAAVALAVFAHVGLGDIAEMSREAVRAGGALTDQLLNTKIDGVH
jgi:hypothetical protein